MDFDSVCMIASFSGAVMTPVWALLAYKLFLCNRPLDKQRAMTAVLTSVLMMLCSTIGPWLAMLGAKGVLWRNLKDPWFFLAMLIMFGLVGTVQIWSAVSYVPKARKEATS